MIGTWFALNVQRAWKSFQAHPMVLLGDVGQVEAHFCPFEDSINQGKTCALFAPNVPWALKSLWAH
jgi:hypothetical protein